MNSLRPIVFMIGALALSPAFAKTGSSPEFPLLSNQVRASVPSPVEFFGSSLSNGIAFPYGSPSEISAVFEGLVPGAEYQVRVSGYFGNDYLTAVLGANFGKNSWPPIFSGSHATQYDEDGETVGLSLNFLSDTPMFQTASTFSFSGTLVWDKPDTSTTVWIGGHDAAFTQLSFIGPQSLPVPGPIAGAGLPGLAALAAFVLIRRRGARSLV